MAPSSDPASSSAKFSSTPTLTELHQQCLVVGEVPVDGGARHLRLFGDLRHRRGLARPGSLGPRHARGTGPAVLVQPLKPSRGCPTRAAGWHPSRRTGTPWTCSVSAFLGHAELLKWVLR